MKFNFFKRKKQEPEKPTPTKKKSLPTGKFACKN